MQYREFEPPGPLGAWIENFLLFSVDEAAIPGERVLVPDGTVSVMLVALPGAPAMALVMGPSATAYRRPVVPGALYAGMRIRPGAAGALLRREVAEIAGRAEPFAALVPDIPLALPERGDDKTTGGMQLVSVLEETARHLADRAVRRDEAVLALAARIVAAEGNLRLSALHDEGGEDAAAGRDGDRPGERQLRRRFLRQVGLTPKALARLRRVRRACELMAVEENPAALSAAAAGFADQAHMSREFRQVFGQSPALVTAYFSQIGHHEKQLMSEIFKTGAAPAS